MTYCYLCVCVCVFVNIRVRVLNIINSKYGHSSRVCKIGDYARFVELVDKYSVVFVLSRGHRARVCF